MNDQRITATQTQVFPPFKKLSIYQETHTVALPYTIASTGQNTEPMETAKDILNKVTCNGMRELTEERALQAMKEIADKAWEAAVGAANIKDCECPACAKDAKRKSTFMESLFPLKDENPR